MSGRKEKPVRVAVDAMGGDYAPFEIVKGAVQAAGEDGVEIILVGIEDVVRKELARYDAANLPLRVVNASEVIGYDESPVAALRQKPDASLVVALQLVKTGEADAMVSMGSTGAIMAGAKWILGTLRGIKRPVMGGTFLRLAPNTVVFDMGANVDCKPSLLLNFAVMGCVVARKTLNITNPTVAILSNGAEEGKGNRLVKETYQLFKNSDMNFIGSVEGHDIPLGKANVIVCDGFTGNVLLKFSEGLGQAIIGRLKATLKERLSEDEIEVIGSDLLALISAADVEGGGMLYGVDGVVIIGHGRAQSPQLASAVRHARLMVETDVIGALRLELAKL